jgi:hypothetical protein
LLRGESKGLFFRKVPYVMIKKKKKKKLFPFLFSYCICIDACQWFYNIDITYSNIRWWRKRLNENAKIFPMLMFRYNIVPNENLPFG